MANALLQESPDQVIAEYVIECLEALEQEIKSPDLRAKCFEWAVLIEAGVYPTTDRALLLPSGRH